MKLVIEQDNYFYGYLDGLEVMHRLNSRDAEQLDDGYRAGDESSVFLSRKSLVKAARQQARRLGGALDL